MNDSNECQYLGNIKVRKIFNTKIYIGPDYEY